MTLWADDPPRKPPPDPPDPSHVTDDPLAALGLGTRSKKVAQEKVYAVSRVNPLFHLTSPIGVNDAPSSVKSLKENFTRYLPSERSPPSGCEKSISSEYSRSPDRTKSRSKKKNGCYNCDGRARIYRLSTRRPRGRATREKSPEIDYERENSGSSGYSGSNTGSSSLVGEAGVLLEKNPVFVKSIRVAGRGLRTSQPSTVSAATLSTIPEGRIDIPVPSPIWPGALDEQSHSYESLVDEALLLYTSLNNNQKFNEDLTAHGYQEISVKDLLLDLMASINQTLEGQTCSPEETLKIINEKIKMKLDLLKFNTEDEMRRLCVNMVNNRKVSSVLRAFSHSSSSGNSSSSGRARTTSNEDLYHIPSGSSSSGFSDVNGQRRPSTPLLPHFFERKSSLLSSLYNDQDTSTLTKGIRNALIYGTLCRYKMATGSGSKPSTKAQLVAGAEQEKPEKSPDKVVRSENGCDVNVKLNCLKNLTCDRSKGGRKTDSGGLRSDGRPSVWQLYYGVKAEGETRQGEGIKPSDVPVFPGGRPETDFTLDVPRSELLSKRLKEDKKWRFRCRVLTSFLGLVFFLLSVMAVSLILTRGKRMFGSMV